MKVSTIVVHCSDSTWGDVAAIDQWHAERGFVRQQVKDKPAFKFNHIGYHRVITNGKLLPGGRYDLRYDGAIFQGRELDEVGAHCLNLNHCSIGVCLIGKDKFTELQQLALMNELVMLCTMFKLRASAVIGHCESVTGKEQGKTCPNLNMNGMRSKLMMRGI
jgi:N-acetylmuramoyl-L-alanine amidase